MTLPHPRIQPNAARKTSQREALDDAVRGAHDAWLVRRAEQGVRALAPGAPAGRARLWTSWVARHGGDEDAALGAIMFTLVRDGMIECPTVESMFGR